MFSLNFTGKTIAIAGVGAQSSICTQIMAALLAQGAEVVLLCHPVLIERKMIARAIKGHSVKAIIPVDASSQESIATCIDALAPYGPFDGFVHGIAFSDKEQLKGSYVDVTPGNLLNTLNISSVSFHDMAIRMAKHMRDGSSMLALTFHASQVTFEHYLAMSPAKATLEAIVVQLARALGERDIRVNAISPGPIKTPSGNAIDNFDIILEHERTRAFLGRNVTGEDIASAALYLLSDLSAFVTAIILLVDGGAHRSAMVPARNARAAQGVLGNIADLYETRQKGTPQE